MEFTSAGDNVLAGLGDVLDLNNDLDNGRDGELHDLHVVCRLGSGEGTALEQELIDTNDVTGGAVFKSLDSATHHENGMLDGLDKQVILLSRNLIGALILGPARTVPKTRPKAQKRDNLQEGLTLEVLLIGEKLDIELLEHVSNLVSLEVCDGIEDLEDGVQDEAVECTVKGLVVNGPPVGGLIVDDLAFDGLPIDSIPVGYVLRKLISVSGSRPDCGSRWSRSRLNDILVLFNQYS